MKNKRLAIFLSIFVALALVIVLSSALFALDSVSITYHSATNILSGDEKVIIQSANFKYGENVFLSNKQNYINNLESANPYINVINIETVFPNKFVIHAVEREQVYAFKTDNYYIITDENLKVLSKEKDYQYENSALNAIEVFNSEYEKSVVKVGDFLPNSTYLNKLFKCFLEWKTSYAELKSNIKSIYLNYVDGANSGSNNLKITMWDNVDILILDSTNRMSDRINFGFSAYDKISPRPNKITVFENSKGEITGTFK